MTDLVHADIQESQTGGYTLSINGLEISERVASDFQLSPEPGGLMRLTVTFLCDSVRLATGEME